MGLNCMLLLMINVFFDFFVIYLIFLCVFFEIAYDFPMYEALLTNIRSFIQALIAADIMKHMSEQPDLKEETKDAMVQTSIR